MSENYKIIAKVDGINQGPHFCNITVTDKEDEIRNIKLDPKYLNELEIGKAYQFIVFNKVNEEREKEIIEYVSSSLIENALSEEELNVLLPKFYKYAPLEPNVIKKSIEDYISKIENKIYKTITKQLYEENKELFYIHPAATKFHHSYVGGLSFHTLTMLNLVEPFLKSYSYLDKDLVYSGIILHDIKKIVEMTGADGEYTKEGQLIGHIVMATIDIDRVARKNNYENSEEVLLLKHTVLAHHGQLNFGSPKKPQIGEALLIWYLDTIDSKLATLGEVLETTPKGDFTPNIPVLDRMRFYKKNK